MPTLLRAALVAALFMSASLLPGAARAEPACRTPDGIHGEVMAFFPEAYVHTGLVSRGDRAFVAYGHPGKPTLLVFAFVLRDGALCFVDYFEADPRSLDGIVS